MTDYNNYVKAINLIFAQIDKMKTVWPAQDNLNYIEKIEEYKPTVIASSNIVKETPVKHIVEELGQ